MIELVSVIFLAVCIGLGVFGFLYGFTHARKIRGLTALLTDTNERLNTLYKWSEVATDTANETIQALCPHDEWVYGYSSFGRLLYHVNMYQKTCTLCGKSVDVSEDEYLEAMKAKELKEIEEARKELEDRQNKVMEG